MSETYTTGGDADILVRNIHRSGQTFNPVIDHTLSYIDLRLFGALTEPEPVILVYLCDAWHHPSGDYISRNRYTVEKHCSGFTWGRARFSMQPVLLYAGTEYAIVVENYPPFLGNDLWWRYDKADATYPRGHRISSSDSGATWTDHWDDDHIFMEFGLPPLPKPEPPPPIDHFAIPNIAFAPWNNGILIYIPTSVPCHLTCYWTDKKPLKHHRSRVVRGLTVPWGTYFCFVAWQAVEQNEPGDTLYHTFTLDPWPICETRWFTFRGNVDDIQSPSVGPIFQFHRSELISPQKFEAYEINWDYRASIWANVWQAQTFTPLKHHFLTGVWLLMSRSRWAWPNLYIDIHLAPDDTPIGPVLSSGSRVPCGLTESYTGSWVFIPLTPFHLKPGVKYAIVAHSNASSWAMLFWHQDHTAATYPRGIDIESANAGATWVKGPDYDKLFQEWGNPFY